MVAEDELTRSAKIALNRWAARYERLENETERLREALRELTKPKYGVATMTVARKALGDE